ncbi:MAG: hypothetical protein U1F36_12575 [Planctomycetota bacterium]
MKRTFPALSAVLALSLAWAQDPIAAPLREALPALLEQSTWRIDSDDAAARGALPIGNGSVFGCLGLDSSACSIGAISGPRYGSGDVEAVGEGAFGAVVLELVDSAGRPLGVAHRSAARVTGCGVVVAEDRYGDVALRLTAFAVTHGPRLIAVLEATTSQDTWPAGVSIRVSTSHPARDDRDRLLVSASGDARMAVAMTGATSRENRLFAPLSGPGPFRGVLVIDCAEGQPPARDNVTVEAARAELERTIAEWRSRLARVPFFDSDNVRVRDLYHDQAVNLLVQTCAQTGAVVAMLGRRVYSLRTQTGGLLALLRLRLHDEARRVITLTSEAICATRRLDESYPLDFDRARASDPECGLPEFWRTLPMPSAELPSLLLLQHYWYWRATRDIEPIEKAALLLETCLKRPTRGSDSLMPFSGSEPWAPPALARCAPELLGSETCLFGEEPSRGRTGSSFVSGVLFLLALQAYGELGDARDRIARPELWANGKPEDAPSTAFLKRTVTILQDVEKRFWIADLERFAPALSPIDGAPVREVLANANLMPLWIGWTYPTGEKSKLNLQHSLDGLWQKGARIGTTRTVPAANGDLIGMLLVALSERDDVRRLDVFDAALDSAAPTACWSDFVDGNGRPVDPDGDGPRRVVLCDPGSSGIVFDALLFAMIGVRYAAIPHWDDDDIRLELRLPHGADYVTMRGVAKDGRVLDIFFRRSVSLMTEEERKANDEMAADRRRDPNVPHERLRFVVELIEGAPKDGYYNTDIDAMGTMFVRYLKKEAPANAEEHDFRRIEEMEFSKPDSNAYFAVRDGAGAPPAGPDVTVPPGTKNLVFTWRPHFAELVRGTETLVVDTGMPIDRAGLHRLMFDSDRARVPHLVLDWDFDAAPPTAWNRTWLRSADFKRELQLFEDLGGHVEDTGFVRSALLDGARIEADAQGALHVAAGDAPRTLRIALPAGLPANAAVHVGSSVAVRILRGDKQVLRAGGSDPVVPDRDAALVPEDAAAEIRIELAPSPDHERVLFARITGADGLPLR